VQQTHTLLHGMLECLPTRNQAHAAGPFVDHRGANRFGEIRFASRGTTRVDKPDASHVTVHDLIATQVDGIIRRELLVDTRGRPTKFEDREATIGFR